MFDSKLFKLFILSTVVLYFFAILYKLSPDTTLYVLTLELVSSVLLDEVGIFKLLPIVRLLEVRLLYAFNLSTVVLYFLAILYKVSPDTIFM